MTNARATCAACPPDRPRPLRDTDPAYACTPCATRVRGWLAELPAQLVVLGASLAPERAAGQPVTRSRTAPIPAREDVLSLLGPGAPAGALAPTSLEEDQVGPLPVAETLYVWAARVRDERDLAGPAQPTTEALAAWLAPHITWTADRPWFAELAAELGDMMRTVRGITRVVPRRRPIPQPCPRCEELALVEEDWQRYRECMGCGSLFTAGELADAASVWVQHPPVDVSNALTTASLKPGTA